MRPGQYRVISRRHRSSLIAALGVAAFAVMSLLAYLIWSGRQNEIHAAETTTRNYAAIIETRLDATLRRIDADLQELARTIPVAGLSQQAATRFAPELNTKLRSRLSNFPEASAFLILDARGERLYTTAINAASGLNFADTDYFQTLRDNPQQELVFSDVRMSRSRNRPIMVVSKALRDGRGTFRGIVVAAIDLDYFEKMFQSLNIGASGIIAIYRRDDFSRVVRWPTGDDRLNVQLPPDSPTRAALASGARTATQEISSSTDGVVRIYSYHVLDRYPFFASVGVSHNEILAAWRTRSLGVGLCSLLLMGLLSGLLYRLLRAEESLRTNAEIMRNTFEQAAVGIAHVDAGTFRILVANNRFCNLLGYTRDELIGSDSRRLNPPESLPAREAERAHLIAGRTERSSSERQLIRKDGALLWVNRSLSLVRDDDGQPEYFISVIEDISARKQAEEALAYLAAIVNDSNDAIISRSLDRRILSWNPAAERLFGYTADEVIGQSVSVLIPPEGSDEASRNREQIAQGRAVIDLETVRLAKGGRRIVVSMSQSPVNDKRGVMVGVALIFRDISERARKTALMRLLEALARDTNEATTTETALQSCLERICTYGKWQFGHFALFAPGQTGGVAQTSLWHCEDEARYAEFMRLSDAIDYNRPSGQFVARAMRERKAVWIEEFARVRDFGRLNRVEKFGLRSGFVFPVFVRSEVAGFLEFFATETRAPDAMLLEAIDSVASQLARLIERNRAEANLALLNVELETRVAERTAELEEANRELNEFSYTIAHDMRAPVRAMNGFSAMVLKSSESVLDPASVGRLKRVVAGSERMGRLIDDLLNLARLSRQEMRRHHFNLSEMAASVAAALAEAQPERSVKVAIRPGMNANGDPGLIRVVLENVIGNAWKFTANAVAPKIEIGVGQRDGATTYYVVDNGAGFDMQYANKLFAPFQRLHHDNEFEGTGIGLATVKKIVQRHGGRIWIESAVGRGTTVFFTLGEAAEPLLNRAPQKQRAHSNKTPLSSDCVWPVI